MVPKKGLEPPRPCGHMDLNHARLPIPPLRLTDWDAAGSRFPEKSKILFYWGISQSQTSEAIGT